MCCIQVHPIRKGRTHLNSFLFNLRLLLLCAPAIIHFQTEIFSKYMIYSTSVSLFLVEFRRISFVAVLFERHVFFYIFVVMSGLTLLWLVCKPNSERLNLKKMIEERNRPIYTN